MNQKLSRGSCIVVAAIAVGWAVGCEVGPNYAPPKQPMPRQWVAPPTTQASIIVQQPFEIERWWTTFNDPELDSLIRRAIAANLDLRAATERVIQARASLGITTSNFFPTASATGGYSRSFSAQGGTGGVKPRAHDLWQAGLDASWELDIFGGLRRAIEAGTANVEASVEDRRDVLVTLLGEVATDYIALRGFQQEIIIARQNLVSQEHSAKVARAKKQLGVNTDLDIAQADSQVASTTATLATQEALEQQEIYSLSILLALPPTELDQELSVPQSIPIAPPVVPVGLPSELLRRRPDIRRAERLLAAATADIGVATADLFPKFSLTGTLTVSGSRYQSLTNWGTRFWSFGPSASWAIFDAGRIWSNIDLQNSFQRQALIMYRQTVLIALQDVQNSLVAYAKEQQRRAALADAVAANQRALQLATVRYNQGLTDFLNVLVAEGSLFSSQDQLVQSNRAVGTDLVAIYKALGGGWEVIEDPPTTRPAQP
jgi:multidrug efflux system outer membrane protein